MNILEQEDIIKGLPDQALMKEASAPSGEVPQFLVISEIKRRGDMRKRYENQQQQNQGTVKDQILSEAMGGIAGMMPPQMAPQQLAMAPMGAPPMGGMPPQGMPPMAPPQAPKPPMPQGGMPPMGGISSMPQGMPPMGMAQGGIVQMAGGGFLDTPTPAGSTDLLTLIAAGASPVELLRRGYTQEQIEATSAEYQAKMSAPAEVLRGMQQVQQAPTGTPRMGYGDQYDPPFIRGITDVIADKASDLADSVGQGMESFGIEAKKNMPNYGLLYGENDLSLPSFEGANPYGLGDLARYAKKGITSIANLEFGGGPYGLPREVGVGIESLFGGTDSLGVGPTGPVSSPFGQQKEGLEPSPVGEAVTELSNFPSGDQSNPFLREAEPTLDAARRITGDISVQGRSPVQTQPSPASKAPSDPDMPALDFADLIAESKQQALNNAIMQIGAGVASGDVAKGLAAAGTAAMKGTADARALDARSRLAEYQAGREDIRRGEEADRFERKMTAEEGQFDERLEVMREEITAKLGISRNANNREVLQSIDLALKTELDKERRAELLNMRKVLSSILSPELMEIMNQDAPAGGQSGFSGFSIRQ